jgi:hypothetical protein
MKIRDLVYDLVIEAEMSQKRREAIQKDLNFLREKWQIGENGATPPKLPSLPLYTRLLWWECFHYMRL